MWLACGATDMRRGMPGLALMVQEALGRDPHADDLFVFRDKQGSLLKILWHDGVGMSLCAKRLEKWRFISPAPKDGLERANERLAPEPPAGFRHHQTSGLANPVQPIAVDFSIFLIRNRFLRCNAPRFLDFPVFAGSRSYLSDAGRCARSMVAIKRYQVALR